MAEVIKMGAKKLRAQATKTKLLECAQKLFQEQGISATSIDSITKAAGVTKGTFYVHFGSKNQIIAEYINSLEPEYSSPYLRLPSNATASMKLAALGETMVEIMEHYLGVETISTIYASQLSGEPDSNFFDAKVKELRQLILDALKLGKENGEFRSDLDEVEAAMHLILGLRGVSMEWCLLFPNFDLRHEAIKHWGYMIRGIATRAPKN